MLISREKIVHYLLDRAHPDGGPKTEFFITQGFRPDDPKPLAAASARLRRPITAGWPWCLTEPPPATSRGRRTCRKARRSARLRATCRSPACSSCG
ncbi:DUF6883 domain-containing protein [Methylobacterium sp. E-065]|uniref:DUF6883 domain-containing protein n=1 Tax=Methylobacterium sp. E-065 TaxID=2836583 RepID=UPI003919FCC6